MSKGRILVVDDETRLVRLLREVFTATGYEVVVASNGERAIEQAALEQPDLIILDIMFPGEMNGLETCRRIREFSDVPIIMLTAKVREADILRGFEMGADDYITKPFNSKELVARVWALLKRARMHQPVDEETVINCGRLCIHIANHRVTVDGENIHLTPTEYKLLLELARHHDQIILHEQLLTSVWGQEYCNDTEYLRAYIYNLRKKIEANPSAPAVIVRYPGLGYSLITHPIKPNPELDVLVS